MPASPWSRRASCCCSPDPAARSPSSPARTPPLPDPSAGPGLVSPGPAGQPGPAERGWSGSGRPVPLLGLLRIAELHGQPHFLRPWLDAERVAQQLRCYHPTLVPGLLKTEHYARAVIRADDMFSDDEVERRLAVRMDRQAILTRPEPPILVAVIEEATLRRADESFRGIMAQQIAHLVDCVQRGGVLIHIIPAELSVHVGLDGPLTLARGAEGDWVGYLENQVGGATIDRAEELATLHAVWEGIRSVALPKGQSELLMKEVM
ncbi:DUF5753 domain-containing protein [Micromonospora sediminimaris]|uniref:DUF5753 domain-containing protein n=1 Tax=Micromonospora sediminimaris TaxID=547162 RepID=UPI0037B118B6